jgi:UDP-2,3-diacylglucosamine pyrophosphatase LpxH
MRHTVVISDIHLAEVEPGSGPWMRYRQRCVSPDPEIAAMLSALGRAVAGNPLTVVLNGDIFDLDAPRVIAERTVFHDLPRTPEHAVPALAAILDDHPAVTAALADLLVDGSTLVFVSGNHDVQLTLPEVRALLSDRLQAAAREVLARRGVAPDAATLAAQGARIVFRAWFHRTPDGVVVEHGHQYDPYCSYRYPMAPFGRDGREIQPTMGSLATRLLIARLGYFNPHVASSIMMSTLGYVGHWARYYLFSRRSIALTWIRGTARTLAELLRRRHPGGPSQRRGNLLAAARETGAPLSAVARHASLFERPAEDRLALTLRELWVDRALLALGSILLGAAIAAWAPRPWAYAGLFTPLAFLLYGWILPKAPITDTWERINRRARNVAAIHGARAVVFGHTHRPAGAWEGSVFHGNSGSWSAAYESIESPRPVRVERPLVWLRSDEDGSPLSGGLFAWKDGRFEPRAYSCGTTHDSATPGSDAANAIMKSTG